MIWVGYKSPLSLLECFQYFKHRGSYSGKTHTEILADAACQEYQLTPGKKKRDVKDTEINVLTEQHGNKMKGLDRRQETNKQN